LCGPTCLTPRRWTPDEALTRFDKLDILITNAAAYVGQPLVEPTLDEWEHICGARRDRFAA
jgi:NADP-dependent 3-hydroxy acid dehydrogenase YdfG